MNLHEYQANELLARHGVPVLPGFAVTSVAEAEEAARQLDAPFLVVKSQIHAGGRGKGTLYADQAMTRVVMQGGVKRAHSPQEAGELAGRMLGAWLQTAQTGEGCRQVRSVYICAGCDIVRELYCSILLDRALGLPVVVASAQGGVNIESVAALQPEAIVRVHFDPRCGLAEHAARRLGYELGLTTEVPAFVRALCALARCYAAIDAELVEINPLVVSEDGRVLALDAKVSVDQNALFRHPDIAAMRDLGEEDPAEVEAAAHGMSFLRLDGTIACLVNGAGLAMATMDAIASHGAGSGAAPANFLDVGGGANADTVAAAFAIMLRDPRVEAILINIFGGIMHCDTIARGVLQAVERTGLDRPLVVRLEGTNVEAGRALLADSDLAVIPATDLAEACDKVVAAAAAWRAERARGTAS